jgi:hypothetical protein
VRCSDWRDLSAPCGIDPAAAAARYVRAARSPSTRASYDKTERLEKQASGMVLLSLPWSESMDIASKLYPGGNQTL